MRARPPGAPRRSRSCPRALVAQEHLGGALRGHPQRRALPRPQRHVIRKFFLHVSKEEQKRRFLERLDKPDKNWKFSAADLQEREHWDDYMTAYEDVIRGTATKHAPWYVVPADNKWFTRVVVAGDGHRRAGVARSPLPESRQGSSARARGGAKAAVLVIRLRLLVALLILASAGRAARAGVARRRDRRAAGRESERPASLRAAAPSSGASPTSRRGSWRRNPGCFPISTASTRAAASRSAPATGSSPATTRTGNARASYSIKGYK